MIDSDQGSNDMTAEQAEYERIAKDECDLHKGEMTTGKEVHRSWRDRLGRLFFPSTYLEPWEDEDGWAPGDLSTMTTVRLDWLDRLRLLISGKLYVHSRTRTDLIINRAEGKSTSFVLPPWAKVNRP